MLSSNTSAVLVDDGPPYIEDVFSTYLYTGNGSTQNIVNGIDLAGKGGMTWFKERNSTGYHNVYDTARGTQKYLFTNVTNAEGSGYGVTAFNADGVSVSQGGSIEINRNTIKYASWTFRMQPKFFQAVTWTGTGSTQNIAHNLASTPGFIIVKRTDTTGGWVVIHREGYSSTWGFRRLDNTTPFLDCTSYPSYFGNGTSFVAPSSTVFTIGTNADINASGGTYVGYVFAHEAGGFGLTGTENVIKCGSYTGTGSTGNTINTTFEPQLVLIKRVDTDADWRMYDNMRNSGQLEPNTSDAEPDGVHIEYRPTGFEIIDYTSGSLNASGGTYIYIAIRRGPMRVPTDPTKVFAPVLATNPAPGYRSSNFNSGIDTSLGYYTPGYDDGTNAYPNFQTRLTNDKQLQTANTRGEISVAYNKWDYMNGYSSYEGYSSSWGAQLIKRAPGFHDVVCYKGTGSGRTLTHNLGAVPEMMIVKQRSSGGTVGEWWTYHKDLGNTKFVVLNATQAVATYNLWNNTSPTSSVFSVSSYGGINSSSSTYVAYLFATCPGVSKVGSYTGTGTLTTINCGFTGGARFVLIKKTSGTSDWYMFDTTRGMVAENNPSISINTYNAQSYGNSVYTITTGFQLLASPHDDVNASGATYIYLAIA